MYVRFRSLRAFTCFTAVALALHLPAVAHAQETARAAKGVHYIEVADSGGGSEGSSGQDPDAGASNPDSSNGDTDSDDSDGGESSGPEGSGHNGTDDRFNGPNGALEAVQSDRALPLDGIVTIARQLTNGQIIDARLHAVKGVLQYELKVLETDNEVRRYSFNARTGKLLKVR
ncbi:PepSY domain-containing protein [Rhizobium miluonense]|uniref:PepSY domain-containing protein n=1 Tax=Rhizobium miluonense TaxID=411945 RepID=UPI000B843C48|nr:hypothetical protein [Rhizobium miluonense]